MIVKLLTEHHLAFLSLKRGCRGSFESTLVKMLEISSHGSFESYSHSGLIVLNMVFILQDH